MEREMAGLSFLGLEVCAAVGIDEITEATVAGVDVGASSAAT